MENIIRPALLGKFMDLTFPGAFFAPYFAVHAKYAKRSSGPWVWDSGRATEECLVSTWDMLAKWQALRAVKVDRRKFETRVPATVSTLAKVLNRYRVRNLRDLGTRAKPQYRAVMAAIQQAVMDVSSIKKTRAAEPMFGSKVLHHYFPSVVPVFDTAMIRQRALRIKSFKAFVESDKRWLTLRNPSAAGGEAPMEFHQYAAFCVAQIVEAPAARLAATRHALGRAIADFAPSIMRDDPKSLLWQLDARAAEFCALGQAVVEGHHR